MINYTKWHSIKREERFALWKVFLSTSYENPILAIGLDGPCLASLSRTWNEVHVYKTKNRDMEWVLKFSESNVPMDCFRIIKNIDMQNSTYSSAIIRGRIFKLRDILRLLPMVEGGGSLVWVDVPMYMYAYFISRNSLRLDFKTYCFLPPTKKRVFVSLENNIYTVSALDLFTPINFTKRLALIVGKLGAKIGFHRLCNIKHTIVIRKPGITANYNNLLEWISDKIDRKVIDANVYAGWSKMILQLFDKEHRIIGFAKLSDVSFGRQSIEREVFTLNGFEKIKELKENVPTILTHGEWGKNKIQVQSLIGERPSNYNIKFTRKHLEFLLILARLDVYEGVLEDWPRWAMISQWAKNEIFKCAKEADAVRSFIQECKATLGSKKILFHRVHGDFTPWNAFIKDGTLKVVDWEDSEALGLPLSDIVNFEFRHNVNTINRGEYIGDMLRMSVAKTKYKTEMCVLGSQLNIDSDINIYFRLSIFLMWIVSRYPSLRWVVKN